MSVAVMRIVFFALVALSNASRAGELLDPTRPPSLPSVAAPQASPVTELNLSLIRVSETDRAAVLGERLVREGDVVEGVRVLRIDRNEVTVIDADGERRSLRLTSGDYKVLSRERELDAERTLTQASLAP